MTSGSGGIGGRCWVPGGVVLTENGGGGGGGPGGVDCLCCVGDIRGGMGGRMNRGRVLRVSWRD